uniref:Thrombospondin-like N-terminal domain-containing protein n=1 Tax=Mola mola TaxID=94237 RepID=A0A3Q3W5M0_MOLML
GHPTKFYLIPLDLLSFVLERDTSKLVPGVHMKQVGGVRGVHFSSPHTSMSFPSSQLLVNCELFPREFSIVVTLKVSSSSAKREASRVKSAERGRLLLGLRLSRERLHFLFRSHGGVIEKWRFQGTRLADNQWHTLVLAIDSHRVSLTVDCRSPLEIIPPRQFPSSLNFQGSRFHVGSRGEWKGFYSGLLRQLVLVPSSDATHQLCPSSEPQLAALSVPSLLSDLPVSEREVSVGLERLCSEQLQGQLWFHPLRRSLYLCDGTVWITLLEDRKRLDYLLEHQVLSTSSETHDIEVFQVPGMGLMAAMAHRSAASGSAVYLWNHTGFRLYQNITTYGALAWRHFIMGKKVFLVVSNCGGGPDEHFNKESLMDFSVIYKWSKHKKQFVRFQTLQTHCARDWEAFKINRMTYLAVANHRQGNNNHTIDSVIYKWNRLTKTFEVHQMLPTLGAYDWEFFTVGPYHFLVVANAFDGVTTFVDSVIYIWIDGSFQVFQTIKTFCATDWEMFQIGSRVFLVVANGHKLHVNGPSQYAINSTIYELNIIGKLFVRFQDIVTYSAVDWEFFSLGEEYFLVVANSFNGESYSLNSIIYRWQGYEGFVPVHWLPTIGCSDWEFFSSKGESYLIYSSAKLPISKVFKLKTY